MQTYCGLETESSWVPAAVFGPSSLPSIRKPTHSSEGGRMTDSSSHGTCASSIVLTLRRTAARSSIHVWRLKDIADQTKAGRYSWRRSLQSSCPTHHPTLPSKSKLGPPSPALHTLGRFAASGTSSFVYALCLISVGKEVSMLNLQTAESPL